MRSYKQVKAIENSWKNKLLKIDPNLSENSGIYVFMRTDEENIKYAYVGQAKHLLTRIVEHLTQHKQHIDNSLYKRKLYSDTNPYGWELSIIDCSVEELDTQEKFWIKRMINLGYQLYNKTLGGQGGGKVGLGENTCVKGYRKGVEYGYSKARKEVSELFSKYLNVSVKKDNKTNNRMLSKFNDFLELK